MLKSTMSLFVENFTNHISFQKNFNIDKRMVHYSSLIRNLELDRDEALKEFELKKYRKNNEELFQDEIKYFCKKLDFSVDEFQLIMNTKPKSHYDYPNSERLFQFLKKLYINLHEKKILIIHHHKKFGGASKSLSEYLKNFKEKFEFDIICPYGSTYDFFKKEKFSIKGLPGISCINITEVGLYKKFSTNSFIKRNLLSYIYALHFLQT